MACAVSLTDIPLTHPTSSTSSFAVTHISFGSIAFPLAGQKCFYPQELCLYLGVIFQEQPFCTSEVDTLFSTLFLIKESNFFSPQPIPRMVSHSILLAEAMDLGNCLILLIPKKEKACMHKFRGERLAYGGAWEIMELPWDRHIQTDRLLQNRAEAEGDK